MISNGRRRPGSKSGLCTRGGVPSRFHFHIECTIPKTSKYSTYTQIHTMSNRSSERREKSRPSLNSIKSRIIRFQCTACQYVHTTAPKILSNLNTLRRIYLVAHDTHQQLALTRSPSSTRNQVRVIEVTMNSVSTAQKISNSIRLSP